MEKFSDNHINIITDISYNIKTNHIFVLAGGQIYDGGVNNWVKERLDLCIKINNINPSSIIYCIGGGTYHKQPIHNQYGHVIHESKSCSNYLIKNNIDSKLIKREWASYDTIANGFFSFTNFIVPLDIKECVLITSHFHIERVKTIFNYFNKLFNKNITIHFIGVENNMDCELLKIREKREKRSNQDFQKNITKINTVQKFIDWFYTQHNAYNSDNMQNTNIDEQTKKSY